jgi:hypothetical protein
MWSLGSPNPKSRPKVSLKRKRSSNESAGLDLGLTSSFLAKSSAYKLEIRWLGTPSMNSEESVMTTCFESGLADQHGKGGDPKLLTLFF